jgi:acyl carrier protein
LTYQLARLEYKLLKNFDKILELKTLKPPQDLVAKDRLRGSIVADATFDVVKRVLVDGLSVDDSAVTMEASLSDDLGADSLDSVELIMSLEEEFDIEIEPAQAETLKTVGDVVTFVDSVKA